MGERFLLSEVTLWSFEDQHMAALTNLLVAPTYFS